LRKLTLPYDNLRTLYEGDSEVRLYRNEITGVLQVGKRFDTLGLERSVAVREATLLRSIRHPHVVPVIDVVRVDGYQQGMEVIELIMPFYERGSLFDVMDSGERFPVGLAVDLAAMILLGLRELHEGREVLHRDLKLPNVFLSDTGSALVGDLGIAVPLAADGTAEPFDSPRAWTPPEAYDSGRLDVRSDIYQMGLLLLELLAGPLPYDEDRFSPEPVAVRLSRGHRGLATADLHPPPWVSPRLRAVIRKATARRPVDRFPTVRLMADALRNAPLVDWHLLIDDPDRKLWEGAVARRPGRRYQVEAVRRGDGAWRLSSRQRLTAWRRVSPDQILRDLTGPHATRVFDEMVAIACNT
jgi:serine/threonine protein kinase